MIFAKINSSELRRNTLFKFVRSKLLRVISKRFSSISTQWQNNSKRTQDVFRKSEQPGSFDPKKIELCDLTTKINMASWEN